MNNKNKIYAGVSISVIVLTVASFIAATNFLLKINNLVFGVDEKFIKEQTTAVNIAGFERIKNKLNPKEKNIVPIISPAINGASDINEPNISPSPILSSSLEASPIASPSTEVLFDRN